ncbi:TetR/AcrR family transcriptional regulator [Nocardia jiangxiensis]|uniref:TetR/AcrR family transcriptional regulator n=1 Tax=Nocardia jiangxiensis TaxID=282685 RepID=A0ABW6SAM2_9NOCA
MFDWSGQTPGRRLILDTFLKLATSKGYSAVTMRMLGKEIDVKAPSIYSHFPGGRDEIVVETLRWHYYCFGVELLESIDGVRDADEAWAAIVRLYVQFQVERPESHFWDLLVESDRIGSFLPPEIREEIAHWLRLCSQLLEATAKELGCADPELSVRVVLTVLEGSNLWADWDGTAESTERSVAQANAITRSIIELDLSTSLRTPAKVE